MTVAINDVDFTTHDIEVLCDAALQVSKITSDELGRWSLNEAFSKSLLQQEVELILESGPTTEAAQLCHKLLDAFRLRRFNPNHDAHGRFAEGGPTDAIQGRPIRGGRKEGVDPRARSRIFKQTEKLAAEHPIAHEQINYRIASDRMMGPDKANTYAYCKANSRVVGTGSEIRVNPSYIGSREAMHPNVQAVLGDRSLLDVLGNKDEITGWHPVGTGNIEGIITHETAHAYANFAVGPGNASQSYWLASQGVSIEDVSAYAHVNAAEFIAESYASYKMSPGTIPLADRIGRALDEVVSAQEAQAVSEGPTSSFLLHT